MLRKSILYALCLLIASPAIIAQNNTITIPAEKQKSAFHLSLFYPVSTGWLKSKERIYHFGLNIFNGTTGGIHGAELGPSVNITLGNVRGMQTGLFNYVKEDMNGLQISLLGNIITGNSKGVLLSGNWTHVQKDFTGWQFSWFGNTTWGNVTGAQLSHLWNHTNKTLRGLQFALIMNSAWEDAYGIQFTSGINIARRRQNGAQFGFIANYAETADGLQIGMINIGKKSGGIQFGLFNYSGDSTAATLGLINIVKKGYNKLEVWSNELFVFNIAAKYGGRKLYSIVSIGTNPFNENKFWSTGWGFGTHIRLGKRFYADLDQITSLVHINEALSINPNRLTIVNQLRFMAGFEITPRVAVFIGPVINTLVSNNNQLYAGRNGVELAPTFRTFYFNINGQMQAALWPGIAGGFRFF